MRNIKLQPNVCECVIAFSSQDTSDLIVEQKCNIHAKMRDEQIMNDIIILSKEEDGK